jgi:hypothetical protein
VRGQPGFLDIDDRLKRQSDLGDQLETFRSAVDFELFRPGLNADGGRPPFDPVLMFKILVIQATNNLFDRNTDDEKKAIKEGPDTTELEGPAGQAAAQGSRRTLDGQIHQGQTARGWLDAASRSGKLFGYQNHGLDRSPFRLHPPMGGHRCGGPMRAVVCAKAYSTRAIRRAGCGPIPPTDRQPTRRS